ncbi:MAG: sigma-54-dependent Fis family transcriptional regulator [Deltaproteobacteria bacterium]|nr:sigma-54-dependent Fis family transcriptional regulator [Deltaproteobacteria bacterium]MBW1921856.1 sigma-54-dependent Fis family transcriptional regulator [Deltaproteobacteria bacterium]MBW1948019.1 sigma-54-dependent Fis family transcriptional regulator [Deltaproteobacteria bacterium]MBW2006946.1 sigma-54-dependent Fis family transcriptional regulator [Deltaproteobacteria bacterium]MBW2102471.1 sigma-54-dependent Fis family transcriptional regulator [Deltaproteobacteria bacterium]
MKKQTAIKNVLVVDDEAVVRTGISRALENRGIRSRQAADGKEALGLLAHQRFDLVLLDIRMPELDGISLLRMIRTDYPDTRVVMITGYPTIDTAVHCVKLGALDYLVKPFSLDDLEAALKKSEPRSPGTEKAAVSSRGLEIDSPDNLIIGRSREMRKIFDKIRKVAPTDSTVLITGESGTGKELVAQAIHAKSKRRDREFVAVDCSALVETLLESELFGHVKGSFTGAHQTKHGFFELANHGTFFFDEIANLSLRIQAKLLRVIQEREFMKVGDKKRIRLDIRIISASNRDLKTSVESGDFREDLYYRLSVVPIHLPPLRKRKEDIPLLIKHFLEKFSTRLKRPLPAVSDDAMDILTEYAWPGNVRELEHCIERILILEDTNVIRARDLPSFITQRQGEFPMFSEEPYSLEELEKKYIRFVLRRTKGRKKQAAEILGINRKTLGLKIKKYGLY